MKFSGFRALFFIVCLVIAAPVSASFISLNTSLSSKYENGRLSAKVSVVNKGDETAYNIQAEVVAEGKKVLAKKMLELPVDGAYQAELSVPLSLKTPGSYPFILITHYTDANQYPFSALTAQTYAYKKETAGPVFGQIRPLSFSNEGELAVSLKNGGSSTLELKTYLLSPRELTVDEKLHLIELAPKSEQKLTFTVKNFSALPGSTYQVFAVSQFEAGGLHYTNLTPGVIRVVASQGIFGLGYTAIFIILGLLIAIFIAAQFIKRK